MSSELVQTGFFDLESVASDPNEIAIATDWMALSDDDFEEIIIERHRELDQQEVAIDTFVNAFKSRIIREKGQLYIAAKAKLKHGKWLNVLERMGVSSRKADEYMQTFRELGDELSNSRHGANLGFYLWRKMARSPEGKQIAARIESGEIEATPKAINDEIEAAKQRAKELEEKYEAKQKELDFFKERSKTRERNREQIHVSQILAFKESEDKAKKERDEAAQRLKDMQEKTANGVMSPEIKEQLDKLQKELDERTKQRDDLAQLREKLSKELNEQRDANKARHEQEMYEHRINDRVKKVTEEFGKCSVTFLGQLPSPIESQVVSGNNWALINHAVDMARRIIETVAQLETTKTSIFIDTEVSNAN